MDFEPPDFGPVLYCLRQILKQEAIRGIVELLSRRERISSTPVSRKRQSGEGVASSGFRGANQISQEKILLLNQKKRVGLARALADRYSDWRKCPYASWSHTDEWLALWVGRKKHLAYGLDVENPQRVTHEILRRISHPLDMSLSQWSPSEVSLLWSVKEASFKALSRLVPKLRVISQIGVPLWQKLDGCDVCDSALRAFRFHAVVTIDGLTTTPSIEPASDVIRNHACWARGVAVLDSDLQIAIAEAPIIQARPR